jgi:hypothetical protein
MKTTQKLSPPEASRNAPGLKPNAAEPSMAAPDLEARNAVAPATPEPPAKPRRSVLDAFYYWVISR